MADGEGTCDYVARKVDPSNWHGDDPDDWMLDREAPVGLEQVWECPHDRLDGAEYCVFHTDPEDVPDGVDEGDRFVEAVNETSAVDDEETARRRKEFVGATFGTFDIEGATLDAGDEHPIRLDHAQFEGGVNAENATFEHSLLARRVRFETGDSETTGGIGEVSFESAAFGDGRVSFESAAFGEGKVSRGPPGFGERGVSFNFVAFGAGGVSFRGATFEEGAVSFRSATFGTGNVSFESTEFGAGGVSFRGATFGAGGVSFESAASAEGEVVFEPVEFGEGSVSFESAVFGGGRVSFESAAFGEGRASFGRAVFGAGRVSFESATFGGERVSFESATFGDGLVSFLEAEFGDGEVSFERAEFGDRPATFRFAAFGAGEVSFDSVTVAAPLSFLDARFDVESTVTFSDAEFRERVAFGFSDGLTLDSFNGSNTPYAQHSLDFSGATFRRALAFRGGTDSVGQAEGSAPGEPEFDFVFAGDMDFSGATFLDGVDFSAVRFPADADFSDAALEDADFSDADLTGTEDTSAASFDGANLTGAEFSRAELAGASFERARLSRAELLGANVAGAKLYGALLGDARINRGTEFWLPEDDTRREPDGSPGPVRALRGVKMAARERAPYCPYDPRYRGSDGDPDLEKAGEAYATPEDLARDNSLPGLASECFLGRKDVQLREYWRDGDTIRVVRSFVPTLVARYGESPGRVLATGAVTVLACGLAYSTFGLITHADADDPVTLFEALYFSALTFTTLGYGDFNPANSAGQVLAVAETSMGVVLLAILVFVFGRRATR